MNITRQATVQNPIISIVTGTYNRLELLQGLFASTRENIPTGIPYEFVINDNGSTDGTLEWLRDLPGNDLTLIESGELVGGCRAFTDAGRAARGKYVLLANDDVAFVGKDSILAAMVHLENNLTCGAVAFYDDRPVDASGVRRFHVLTQPAIAPNGKQISIVYAQVGLYRKWLGDLAGWWGADDPAFKSRTYGGDNYLTCQIVERGYTVDPVEATRVHDYKVDDELRKLSGGAPEGQTHPDTAAYLKRYPHGPQIAPEPTVDNPDKRQLRVLYCPILDGGPYHEVARKNKHGLRDALAKLFITVEYDYVNAAAANMRPHERQTKILDELTALVRVFQPDLLLTQIHDTESFTAQTLSVLRSHAPRMVVVNWNGDYWAKGLTTPPILSLLRHVDLQLVVNASALETYKKYNVPAAYWQNAYELSTPYEGAVNAHDVVYMGNNYSKGRANLIKAVRAIEGINVGVYGYQWDPPADGITLYNFPLGEAIYKASKIAIGDNQYPDGYGYVSNRIFQALGAGGALLLHQTVPGLEEMTGIKAGVHYIEWTDLDDLREKITFWLDDKQTSKRKKMAAAAARFIREHHTFDARVRELVKLMPMARRVPDGFTVLEFVGAREQFGVVGPVTTRQYVYTPGKRFIVDARDAQVLMQRHSSWVEKSVESV